jgi:hypothetical protein
MITDKQEKGILYYLQYNFPIEAIELRTKIPAEHIRTIKKYHQLKGTFNGEKENPKD